MSIKNNKSEAEVLISYAKANQIQKDVILSMLDVMLLTPDNIDFQSKQWNWTIAKFIQDRMLYITVEQNIDADFEKGEWGIPIPIGAVEHPTDIKIEDRENLIDLRFEIDNILNKIEKKIKKFLEKTERPKWECKKCNRFLGSRFSSFDEIKKFIKDFYIGKYRKCRYCGMLNKFDILDNGDIVFYPQPDT